MPSATLAGKGFQAATTRASRTPLGIAKKCPPGERSDENLRPSVLSAAEISFALER